MGLLFWGLWGPKPPRFLKLGPKRVYFWGLFGPNLRERGGFGVKGYSFLGLLGPKPPRFLKLGPQRGLFWGPFWGQFEGERRFLGQKGPFFGSFLGQNWLASSNWGPK